MVAHKLLLEILACPDCRARLSLHRFGEGLAVLLCSKCDIIYPICDQIPIMLPAHARNPNYEIATVAEAAESRHLPSYVTAAAKNTLAVLKDASTTQSWEWEDEAHWSREYAAAANGVRKSWNDRYWQRLPLLKAVLNSDRKEREFIIDIGCGDGHNFRSLVSRLCTDDTVYVGADISLAGLRLNRRLTNRSRAIYVCCAADSLPFQKHIADVVCLFGILHHTRRKHGNITDCVSLLKSRAWLLLHEAVVRQTVLPDSWRPHRSAHEERLEEPLVQRELNSLSDRCEVVFSMRLHSILFSAAMRLCRKTLLSHPSAFSFVSRLDVRIIAKLGQRVGLLDAGKIMYLLRRSS